MTVEVRPLGVKCNIQCQYCYQNPQRDANNSMHSYDIATMKEAISKEGGPFTLFGGEPLLVPHTVLEDLFAWGFKQFGSNGIQTNGALIDDEHIRMFKTYKVEVGISVDGPGRLNDVRWAGTRERTRTLTRRTHRAIRRLCENSIPPGLIVTLHRGNAVGRNLKTLLRWTRKLDALGVSSVRLHLLEVEDPIVREHYALSNVENIEALLRFARLQSKLHRMQFDVFRDMQQMLLGADEYTTCIWNACDPLTTHAVRGIEGDGQRTNCGRTNKDGIDFVKAGQDGYERYIALYNTPQKFGGCQGCRFFLMCKGQCPGSSIDSDWRNRTDQCEIWKTLYEWMEAELLSRGHIPLSLLEIRADIEHRFLERWEEGSNSSIAAIWAELRSDTVELPGVNS
jgi:radical SAM protein with 4Fe4S-binding SPASM domain